MEKIREVAIVCVGRAVMFGSLAIGCVMIGFSFNPVSAFRAGAVTTLIMAAILMWKAATASRRNPRHTEVWLYLDEQNRRTDDGARFVFNSVMVEVYGRFARITLAAACVMFAVSVGLGFLGFEPYRVEQTLP